MNTSFSNLGYDSNSNFYNLDWSYQFDFSWSAQTTGNYAPQFHEMHHSDYLQFDHQAQPPTYQVPQPTPQSSLEEMMKAFIQSIDKNLQALTQSIDKFVQATNKNIQELKNATMANSKDIHKLKSSVDRIEGKIDHLVTELNRIEEEELQSQLMIERHYTSDEDDSEILIMNIPKSPPHLMRMKSWIMKRSKLSTMSELSTMRKVSPQQILIYPMTWK
jgi:hypothetical protein